MPSEIKGTRQLNTFKQAKAYFKETIFKGLKDKVDGLRRRSVVANALSFSRTNKDCLVIIADTKKDDIVIAYNGHYAVTKVVSKYFKAGQKIIKSIVYRTEKDEQVAEHKVSEFLQVIDAFLFNFSSQINKRSDNTNPNNKTMTEETPVVPEATPEAPVETPETPAEEKSAE